MAGKKNIKKYIKKSKLVTEPEKLVLKEEPQEVLKKEEVKKDKVLVEIITEDRDAVSKLIDEGYKVIDQTVKDGKLVYTLKCIAKR